MIPYIRIVTPFVHIVIPSYALMTSIGVFVALVLIEFRNLKFNIPFKVLLQLACACGLGVLVGSKVLFIITKIPDMIRNFSLRFILHTVITSGFVFYGGLFGAIVASILYSRYKKYNVINVFNLVVPGFLAFHIMGRIGCLLAGCCYGIEAEWGIPLHGELTPRIPIQLIEALCNLLILIGLLFYEKRQKKAYELLPRYLFTYGICRFILEFFRGDEIRGVFGAFSTSQWISLTIIFVIPLRSLWKYRLKSIKAHEELS